MTKRPFRKIRTGDYTPIELLFESYALQVLTARRGVVDPSFPNDHCDQIVVFPVPLDKRHCSNSKRNYGATWR